MNKLLKKIVAFAVGGAMLLPTAACARPEEKPGLPVEDPVPIPEMSQTALTVASTASVDAYGRTAYASLDRKESRDVGLFYFLWLGAHGNKVYDISDLLENNPDALWDPEGTTESPTGSYHFWGEPLYGYYRSDDPWVITRHVELFTMAGIDFLGFDVTNAVTYDNVVIKMLEILDKYQKQGWDVPKIMFITNSGSKDVINSLYAKYYKEGAEHYYPDLWYAPEGKPMICGNPRNFTSDSEIGSFFDIRKTDWPNDPLHDEESFPWMDWTYPQRNFNGIVSISVAQHTTSRMSLQESNWGRGYDQKKFVNDSDRADEGINFESQWDTVFNYLEEDETSVHTVFMTGWNEWIAIKFAQPDVYFVDTFNKEYSRDLEMMKGGYGDNFYQQMLRNTKEFKYNEAGNYIFPEGTEGDWSTAVTYLDFEGDAMERNFAGYDSSVTYTDKTNRNDIVKTEVMQDEGNYYFRITAASDITKYEQGDTDWMNIWIATAAGSGYNYVINREYGKISKVSATGYETAGNVEITVSGNIITVKVSKTALGSPKGLRIRVSDNVDASDPMNFYIQGDSAPIGALGYTYGNL